MGSVRRSHLAAVLPLALILAAGAGAPGHATPRCFGASSRDTYRPCRNSRLDLIVQPTPARARFQQNSPCRPVRAPINVCAFGVSARDAVGDIALVGDSHAWHWRAGVAFVARALHWHGLDSTRTSCSFSWGIPLAPEPQRAVCAKWNRAFVRWLRQRPEITTVFTSNHPESVRAAPHQDGFSAQVAGIKAAWAALPPTVKHIIVIRDIPYMPANVLQCVEDAIRRRLNAGLSCAQPRARALLRDPDVAAAELVHSRRVEVFDPTRFFCDSHLCYPVVGGALVYRNADHLTETFAASVGPYLLHALIRLMTSWR